MACSLNGSDFLRVVVDSGGVASPDGLVLGVVVDVDVKHGHVDISSCEK